MTYTSIDDVIKEMEKDNGEPMQATFIRFYFEKCGREIAISLAELYMKLKGIKFNEKHNSR